jgi:four helix bundle protein
MGSYRNLIAWQKAMDLVDAVYLAVRSFPRTELFGLTDQMKSAAIGIPSDLAEGCGRRHTIPDQRHLWREARGSVYELQTQIEIARRQGFISLRTSHDLMSRADEVGRLINGLLRRLTTSD